MTTCPTCTREWTGLAECHCGACHRHFGSLATFDGHRTGPDFNRVCSDPSTLTKKDGTPRFTAADRASGPVWVTWQSLEDIEANRARFAKTEPTP
jgi:hypothetical protein